MRITKLELSLTWQEKEPNNNHKHMHDLKKKQTENLNLNFPYLYSSWPAVSSMSNRHVSPSITTCFLYESSEIKQIFNEIKTHLELYIIWHEKIQKFKEENILLIENVETSCKLHNHMNIFLPNGKPNTK